MNHDDICMQCGHTRNKHNADGCMVFTINPELDKPFGEDDELPVQYIKCGCVLDNKQGKTVKL